jgi:hypothetical protein
MAAAREPGECAAADAPRVERHRRAVREVGIAQQPGRVGRPGQHPERGRIRDDERVRAALHLGHPESTPRGEDRKHGAVRGVLGEQRGDDAHTVRERFGQSRRRDRLPAQQAVEVCERESDELDAARRHFLQDVSHGRALGVVPEPVALDEGRDGHGADVTAEQHEARPRRGRRDRPVPSAMRQVQERTPQAPGA